MLPPPRRGSRSGAPERDGDADRNDGCCCSKQSGHGGFSLSFFFSYCCPLSISVCLSACPSARRRRPIIIIVHVSSPATPLTRLQTYITQILLQCSFVFVRMNFARRFSVFFSPFVYFPPPPIFPSYRVCTHVHLYIIYSHCTAPTRVSLSLTPRQSAAERSEQYRI